MFARVARWSLVFALAGPVSGCKRAPSPHVVAFVDDDLAAATARAKREKKLLFVDAWATWCHTCLSLKAFVLSDPRLGTLEDRYVFASIDTEKPSSAAFVEKHPMRFWPTLFVIDPAKDQTRLAFAGSLPIDDLVALLEDVDRGASNGAIFELLADADLKAASGSDAEAVIAYRAVLSRAPAAFPRRARVVESISLPLGKTNPAGLVALVLGEAPSLPRGNHLANALTSALDASEAAGASPSDDRLLELARSLLRDAAAKILDDDRSSLFEAVVQRLTQLNRPGDAKVVAIEWSRFLDGRAEAAMSPATRAVFDAHRVLAYEAIGELGRARSLAEASERAFPDDYNHPARLARVLRQQGDLDAANAAAMRALAKAYGPRKLRVAELAASISRKQGDETAARRVVDDALREVGDGPLPPSYQKLREKLKAAQAAKPAR